MLLSMRSNAGLRAGVWLSDKSLLGKLEEGLPAPHRTRESFGATFCGKFCGKLPQLFGRVPNFDGFLDRGIWP